MSKLRDSGRISSVISIWEAPACKVSPNADQHKKAPTSVIGIEALRSINRIVLAIRERIEGSERTKLGNDAQPCPAGDPRSSRTTNSNSGTDSYRGEEDHR